MGVLILITKPARRVSNRRRGERTLTTGWGCAAPPPADRGEGPDGKGKSPAENDPRCEDPDTHTRFRQVCRCVPASATARAVLALVHAAEGLTL